MNRLFYIAGFLIIFSGARLLAQSEPILYTCESYDPEKGEVNISDRFSTGYLTVVVRCDNPLNLTNVKIEFDKYDHNTLEFNYYKQFSFTIDPAMNYVYFSKNESSDMSFEEPGFYRVFLLNESDESIASALVQIVR